MSNAEIFDDKFNRILLFNLNKLILLIKVEIIIGC